MNSVARALAVAAAAVLLASCGLIGDKAAEASAQACAALQGASTAVAAVTAGRNEKTVGDLENQLTAISTKLDQAQSESTALSGPAITKFQDAVAAAQKQVAGLDPSTPIRNVKKLDATRATIKTTYQQATTALRCS